MYTHSNTMNMLDSGKCGSYVSFVLMKCKQSLYPTLSMWCSQSNELSVLR